MTKDVIIDIKGTQGIDDDTNTIELTTEGKFGVKDDSFYISYDESKLMGVDNVKSTLYIKSDNTFVLQRSGAMNSRLTVENGVRNTCIYNTPHGEIVIGIFGESVEYDLTENGGNIFMRYTIDSNLNLISRNTVNITIREVR